MHSESNKQSPSRRQSYANALNGIKNNSTTSKLDTTGNVLCKLCGASFTLQGFAPNTVKAIKSNNNNLWTVCNDCNGTQTPCKSKDLVPHQASQQSMVNDTPANEDNVVLKTIISKIEKIENCLNSLNFKPTDTANYKLGNTMPDPPFCDDKHIVRGRPVISIAAKDIKPETLEIRLDGVPEYTLDENYWQRTEHDRKLILQIMHFLEAESFINNVHRVGKAGGNKPRRLIFSVNDDFIFKKLLANAKKLKNYEMKSIYLNRNLTGDEARQEKIILRARWKLINEDKVPRNKIAIKHGQLFVEGNLYLYDTQYTLKKDDNVLVKTNDNEDFSINIVDDHSNNSMITANQGDSKNGNA